MQMRVNQSTRNAVIVRALRTAFNLSQSDLAQVAKTSRPTVNRIESLDQNARLETIESILEVFRSTGVRIEQTEDEVVLRFPNRALKRAEEEIRKTPRASPSW
ncbi:MAG: helix-turn-helix domain-containing protein [Betaproteobacteria bacterium]|nr:helix-turn-helix domain-containing protein [Betaproteobacteria bacterium]